MRSGSGPGRVPAPPGDFGGFGPLLRLCGGRKKKLDKEPGSTPRLLQATSARSAGSYGSFRSLENGVKNGRETKFCGRYPAELTPTRKNQGSTRRKEAFMSQKEKFALYLTPEMKARLERRYTEDGSRSLTGFIENAINFYGCRGPPGRSGPCSSAGYAGTAVLARSSGDRCRISGSGS